MLALIAALESEGQATAVELCEILGLKGKAGRELGSAILSRLRKRTKTKPKRVYVVRWTYESVAGARAYLRPVLALGNNPDAKKPPPRPMAEVSADYRKRERHFVGSVFMWAQPRRVRHAARRSARAELQL
jgi:hypothetical protein